MLRRSLSIAFSALVLCSLATSFADAQPARRYIDSALAAMGGREALLALQSQRLVSHGENFEPGQTFRPGMAPRKVSNFTCTLVRDLTTGRIRYEWQRETLSPFPLTWRYVEIINGDYGAILGADGARSPARRPLPPPVSPHDGKN